MRSTKALAVRMRQLLSNIHPPQPPTSRESQQLLNVLQSSFRRQLDEAHPSPSGPNLKRTDEDGFTSLNSSDGSAHATSHHLKAVLTHPLLEQSDRDLAASNLCLRSIRAFERALSESQVSVKLATSLIKQYIQGMNSGYRLQRDQQLSPLVDMWLTASSLDLKQDFLSSSHILRSATSLMSREGQESKIWQWLRMVYERRGISASLQDPTWLRVEDNIVSNLMRLAIEFNQVPEATQQFVQACRYRIESGRADVAPYRPNKNLPYEPLASSWMRLGATIVHLRQRHSIPGDLFDAAMKYSLDWTRSPETSKSFCLLYHPVSPTAKPLYNALQLSDHKERLVESQKKAGKASRKAMMTSLLDGAQLSVNQGSRRQAEYLLDFAIDHYPDFLPRRETSEVEPQLQMSSQYAFG